MVLILNGSRDGERDQREQAKAVLKAEQARDDFYRALREGRVEEAHQLNEKADVAIQEVWERAMDREASMIRSGDTEALARANNHLLTHHARREQESRARQAREGRR
jgi:hypothetical protein